MDRRRFIKKTGGALAAVGAAASAIHAPSVIALERLKTEFKGKVEIVPLPTAVLAGLKKMAQEVIAAESTKSPMAKKVHASFSKFQTQLGGWRHISEGTYHQFVA